MRTKTRFHKLTAWLLTLAMLMTFIPSFTFTAFAEDAAATITGVTVYVNDAEVAEAGNINITEGDSVKVVFKGENFDKLTDEYVYLVGGIWGTFVYGDVTIDTVNNTATVSHDASSMTECNQIPICYANAGESETETGYTLTYLEKGTELATIYFKNTEGWTEPYVYFYDSKVKQIGTITEMMLVEGESDIYSAAVPESEWVYQVEFLGEETGTLTGRHIIPTDGKNQYNYGDGTWTTFTVTEQTTKLDEAVEAAEALNSDDYTVESWAAVEEALEAAKAVLADPDATQEEVDAAVNALEAAIEAIVPTFSLVNERVFYYPEDETGFAELTFSEESNVADNYTVNVLLKDGSQVLAEENDIEIVDNYAVFNYDLSLLTKKEHAYTVLASMTNSEGEVVSTMQEDIYIYDRPTVLNENNEYVEDDGSIFNPVYAFSGPDQWDELDELAAAGVNTLLWNIPSTEAEALQQLDDLHDLGMKANVVMYWDMEPTGHPTNAERVIEFMNWIKDHPAIYAWNVANEPYSTANPPEGMTVRDLMIESYKVIRSVDKKYPVTYVEDDVSKYAQADDYADIVLIAPYPGTDSFATYVGDRTAAITSKVERPVGVIHQPFASEDVKPTDYELHSMIYQGYLAGGAQMGYYGIGSAGQLEADEELWPVIKGIYKSGEWKMLFEQYSSGVKPPIVSSRESDIWYDVFEQDGGLYIALQNRTYEDQTTTVVADSVGYEFDYIEPIRWGNDVEVAAAVVDGDLIVTLFEAQAVLLKINTKAKSPYTITFDANGGTVTPTSAETGADGKLTELPTPTRTGYTFNGWFDAATGGTEITTETSFADDATIYAQWTAEKYEIYVSSVQVTAENAANVLGDGAVSYDAETNTLTLTDATINNTNGVGIEAKDSDITIVGVDTDADGANAIGGSTSAIKAGGEITIKGKIGDIIGGFEGGVYSTNGNINIDRDAVLGNISSDWYTLQTDEGNIVIDGTVGNIKGLIAITSEYSHDVIINGKVGDITGVDYGIFSYKDYTVAENAEVGNIVSNGAGIMAVANIEINGKVGDVSGQYAIRSLTGKVTINSVIGTVKGECDDESASVAAIVGNTGIELAENIVIKTPINAEIKGGTNYIVYDTKGTEETEDDTFADTVEFAYLYTVTFETGDGSDVEGQSVIDGDAAIEPNAPTLNGYKFGGWYTDTDYTTEYDFDTPVSEDITIYAKWTKKSSGGGSSSSSTTTTTTKNEDGSTTKTTINKRTGTTTETTTYPDGSTTKVETKKDGTVTTTEKDKDGNTTTTVENPDGTSTTTEKNKDGSETVVEKEADGTTTTTEKDSEGNKTVTTEKADGTTTTEETKKDGTTVKTETTANGETTAEVEAKGEIEVVIPVDNADEVTKVIVTDKDGNETEVEFEVKDGGIAISVSGNSTVSVQTGHICYAKDFTDVDLNSWYHLNIDYVLENGLFKGTTETTFAPNDNLTRAMLVTVLYRAEGEPATNRSIPFADVDMGSYYANAVIWAQQNGIVKGVSETEFAPNDNITREQIAAILYRYAIYKGMDAVNLSENLSFTDADEISEYAISALNWAVGTGLIKGYEDNTVRPINNATRAEAAALLERFIKAN